jgi:hypothetical protein
MRRRRLIPSWAAVINVLRLFDWLERQPWPVRLIAYSSLVFGELVREIVPRPRWRRAK